MLPHVHPGEWDQVDRNFQKLVKHFIGPDATPTYTGLTLSGLTDNSIIYTTSGVLTSLGAATNGQIPIGSTGAVPVLAGVTGTSNQITVTNGAGSITLSLPQDYDTGATPTLADLTLSAPSNIYALSHDSFADFVANEHIDHTSVTLTAGTGLTGGGDISANRTFAVDGVLEDLDTLGANSADSEFLVGTGAGALAWENAATARTSMGAVAAHAILDGSVHTDSVADAVTRGSIIYGNATPKWDELVVGADGTFLGSDGTDLSYRTINNLTADATPDTAADYVMSWDADAGAHKKVLLENLPQAGVGGKRINVYRSAAQSVNATTWTKIQFDTENYDALGEYDNAVNYRYTAGSTGYYHITANVTLTMSADGDGAIGAIRKDGTTDIAITYGTRGVDASSINVHLSKTVYLEATDYIEIRLYHFDGGGARNVTGTIGETYLTVDRVTEGGTDEKVKIDAAATEGYIGAASNDGVLRTGAGLSYADGGDFITLTADVGIADDKLLQMDDADAADDDYVRLTANGAEGRSAAEVAADLPVLQGDATAGRVFRVSYAQIEDGTNANTLKVTLVDVWNGDGIAVTDNIAKNATTGNYYLTATGKGLRILDTGLSGNPLMAFPNIGYNDTATPLMCTMSIEVAPSDAMEISCRATADGTQQDITALVDAGTIVVYILYITDA